MIATIVIAIATVVYVCLTYKLLKSTDRPEVAVFLYFERTLPTVNFSVESGYLCVQNVGARAARNIQFEVDSSFIPREGIILYDLNILENGIDVLVPKSNISRLISTQMGVKESSNNVISGDSNSVVKIVVKYQDFSQKEYKDSFTLDFRDLTEGGA